MQMQTRHFAAGLFMALAIVHAALAQEIELRDGDRVAFVGATFVERMQMDGDLELLLTITNPDKRLVFRNLGWSGDTVWGESRGVFGGPNEGFARLLKDLKQTNPTLVVLFYGANEAHAGASGVENFVAGLNRLLDALADTKARFALVAPHERLSIGKSLPDPASYNENVKLYAAAIAKVAQQRGAAFVDLGALLQAPPEPIAATKIPLVENGQHLTAFGYWATAPRIAKHFSSVANTEWRVAVNMNEGTATSNHGKVTGFAKTATGCKFSFQSQMLPYALPPASIPPHAFAPLVLVSGLSPGNYELKVDGESVARFSADERSSGIPITRGGMALQLAELQKTIRDKNELFFHRHRPQNETYLFLFRKHEQGNNAVEIPQFDPLIEAKEKQIDELKQSRVQMLEIVRLAK